jgi:hypothetical protein
MNDGRTIRDMIEAGESLWVTCHNPLCGKSAELDVAALADRLGPDHGAMHDDLVTKFRCSKCGGKRIGFTYIPAYRRRDRARMARG